MTPKADSYPKCVSCDWWNELTDWDEVEPLTTYRTGMCEHPNVRGDREKQSHSPRSAIFVQVEPRYFFNPGEDFGCVLHSAITPTRRTHQDKRLKINAPFKDAVKKSLLAGSPTAQEKK